MSIPVTCEPWTMWQRQRKNKRTVGKRSRCCHGAEIGFLYDQGLECIWKRWLWLLTIFFWCLLPLGCFGEDSAPLPSIETAQEHYMAGVRATTPEGRAQHFNDALAIYLPYLKRDPSGMVLNNVGNIYFSLGDFGTAVCYYRRAATLMPRDDRVRNNLRLALSRAEIVQQERPLADVLGLRWCSPLERTGLIIGAIAVTLVFFSLNLWLPGFGFFWLWRVSAALTGAVLAALMWYVLFIPPQAVVVRAAPLRASSETAFTEPSVTTVRPGEVVDVLGTAEQREWVRVRTASQVTGYLPGQNLCFIE